MAKLPNHSQCFVPEMKLSGYLLNPEHVDGHSKAQFLSAFGFERESPDVLRDALIAHATANDIVDWRVTEFGTIFEIFEVDGQLASPDTRNPTVRTVWMIANDNEKPKFITLVPLNPSP